MNPSQALDLGLNATCVFLMMAVVLLSAQAASIEAEQRSGPSDPVTVHVAIQSDDSYTLDLGDVQGDTDDLASALVERCAVDPPPVMVLTFEDGALLNQARRVRADLRSIPGLICSISM